VDDLHEAAMLLLQLNEPASEVNITAHDLGSKSPGILSLIRPGTWTICDENYGCTKTCSVAMRSVVLDGSFGDLLLF
jgi:hypothetical protein